MKCRCGSGDKLISEGGKVLRIVDKQPHICLGEEAPKSNKVVSSAFSEKEIQKINTELDKLVEIEKIVIQKLKDKGDVTPNPAKVGMYMKFIYELRSSTLA